MQQKKKGGTGEFGVEAKATVDSRIYERPSFFLGMIFIIAFGGIGSKYESVSSVEHEGKAVVILYHGLCLVSAGDRLLIRGKWYQGKKTRDTGKCRCSGQDRKPEFRDYFQQKMIFLESCGSIRIIKVCLNFRCSFDEPM